MISGIINVNKEKGMTSHSVIYRLRKILGVKKMGHTGTLDPDATGVLPVCIGPATKLCGMFTDADKEYEASLLLGIVTDTQDMTGTVLEEKEVCAGEDEVIKVIKGFEGDYDQLPPMYSAVKIKGKKLYELAREGLEVERKSRRVNISSIIIEKIELPRVQIRVACSKGTYIRTLCHDIGEKLGCGGCMESLVRTRTGMFAIEDATTISGIEKAAAEGRLHDIIMPTDMVFSDLPDAACTDENVQKWLYNGNPLEKCQLKAMPGSSFGKRMRLYDLKGMFVGVYTWEESRRKYLPEKMFYEYP